MTEKRGSIEVVPGARRLVTSLRDEGYDFVTAAADIIDNSIQAGASEINITMKFDGNSSWFLVSDNGRGMDSETLTESMRFGTNRTYEPGELGKFGLGLKTASISQCRKLTVASKTDESDSEIEIRQLNLDHIQETDRWEIQTIPKSEYSPVVSDPISHHSGTVVLWENLDRMMAYDPPDGMRAQKGFMKMARDLERHLSMVFHRFLSGELGPDKKVVIKMGDEPLSPWDPFARTEKSTLKLDEKTIAVPGSDRAFYVHYTAYLLPTKAQFSTLEAWKNASGPNDWNAQQGFYIYREDRLIQSGGWNRMRAADEHTKYARIALDLHADADFTLGLNIMKSSVVFPSVMKDGLRDTVEKLCSLARSKYTPDKTNKDNPTLHVMNNTRASVSASDNSQTNHPGGQNQQVGVPSSRILVNNVTRSSATFNLNGNQTSVKHYTTNQSSDFNSRERNTLGRSLELAAEKIGESRALQRIRSSLKQDDPEAANSLGW
jgi:hypothetical protein